MAQLIAAAGTAIGGPIGGIIGGIIGNILFPPDPIKTEGPRLGDLAVTSSAYGAPRSIGYGTIRISGNIIWATPIREQKNTKKSGGKGLGGPKQEATSYTYFSTFALAFGEGPAEDVLRIWADGKIIFDKTSLETNTTKQGLVFRFYPGDTTQLPDPAIVADKGLVNTPAYRNTCYILFDDLALADFGNRIPNITCEITYAAATSRLQQISTAPADSSGNFDSNLFAVDWDRGYSYYFVPTSTGSLQRANLNTLVQDRFIQATDMISQTAGATGAISTGGIGIAPDGALIATLDLGNNSHPIVRIDPNTLRETARFGDASNSTSASPTNMVQAQIYDSMSCYGLQGRVDFMIVGSESFDSFMVLKLPNLNYIWDNDTFLGVNPSTRFKSCLGGLIGEGFGEGWVTSGARYNVASSENLVLTKLICTPASTYALISGDHASPGFTTSTFKTFTPNDLVPGATELIGAGNMVYDETDNTILISAEEATLGKFWIKYDPVADSILWRTVAVSSLPTKRGLNQSRLTGYTFGYISVANGVEIDTVTGAVLFDDEAPDWAVGKESSSYGGAYDSSTRSFVSGVSNGINARPMIRFFFNRGGNINPTLDTIITDLCLRSGLVVGDLDVTDLTTIEVPGYFVGRQATARASIEPLTSFYLLDGFESDFKLVFKQRGNASIRSLVEDQLGVIDNKTGDVFRESRVQEVELPLRFTLTYMDKDQDYVQQSHSAKRILDPDPAMNSNNELGLSLNIALDVQTAKQQAEKALYSAWIERNGYQFKLDWSQLDLDPSDVITITLDNGTIFRTRITQVDIGDGFVLDADTLGEQSAQFVSTVIADGGAGVINQSVKANTVVKTFVIDTPLLRDIDEAPGRTFNPIYFFMGGYSDGSFTKGFLYFSADDISYDNIGVVVDGVSWGGTTNALGDIVNPFATDTVNTLNIFMNVGGDDLVSVTNLQMLNGANAAMLLKLNGEIEIIQYQNVTLEDDGSYTLDTLLRGQRGSDTMTNGHTGGEILLILDGISGDLNALNLGQLDTSVFYRGVGTGQLFEDGERISLTSNHRALMPYAPVQVEATEDVSNNIDFTWVRRTRIGGELVDSFSSVPLNEDTEQYDLEILDGPGGSIVRTINGLTTPAYEYLNADIITDLSAVPSTITVNVYQVSAQAGRGFSKEVTVEVL